MSKGKKVIEIEMMTTDEKWEKKEFEAKKTSTPFQYMKDLNKIAEKYGQGLDGDFALATKYFPQVFGKEQFAVKGLNDDVKFSTQLEEFFINDPMALQELTSEMGFFLNPALKKRIDNQG